MPRILFLENHNESRDGLVETLRERGYEVIRAQGGREAQRVDLAVVDVTGGDAYAALASLQAQSLIGSEPLLVLADTAPVAPLHKTPVVGWLVAPFDNLELVGALRAALNARVALNGNSDAAKLLTEIARVERERDSFEQADHKKDEFISYISHELKNPMASIKGYSDLLRRRLNKTPEDPNRKGLEIISTQVGRMTVLLDQLLDFSRISMDRLQLDLRPVNLESLAQRLVDELQPTTSRHALQFFSDGGSQIVIGDENRLQQALQYLLTNAIKFSPEPGTIVVALRSGEDGDAQIAISDKGIGIPTAEQPHVFERFFRASNVDPNQSGLGLGLFLASEIVTRHGGRITVEGEEGQGSTFTVILPRAETG